MSGDGAGSCAILRGALAGRTVRFRAVPLFDKGGGRE
jgi:hypothetical protein